VGRRTSFVCVVLCAGVAAQAAAVPIAGTVKDSSGAAVAEASVVLLSARHNVIGATRSDSAGAFALEAPSAGTYVLQAELPGLAVRRQAVSVHESPVTGLELRLVPASVSEEITVTANPGSAEGIGAVSQQVNVIDRDDITLRAKQVIAQVGNEEAGIHLQRTSPTMAAIFVRGLTGAKVSVFVDGQRYSTAAARGGVSTFFDLVDPSVLDGVEVLRGPSSAQYGSDSIGGSIQFLTKTPAFSPSGPPLSGSYSLAGSSADGGFGSYLTTSYSKPRFAVLGTVTGRRVNTLRAGGGTDSHNSLRRYFGVDPEPVLDEGRLPDTAFTQYGGHLKAQYAVSDRARLVASYTRSQQDGGKRYDQLLGGDGNLIADLRNLMLDRGSVKYERARLGAFDSLSLGYSFNSQREERVNQGGTGNPRAAINHEYERTNVHGLQASAGRSWRRHALTVGGDLYREKIDAPSFASDPVNGVSAVRRGRVPDEARFDSAGVYAQDVFEAIPGRLQLAGNLRFSHASYESRAADSPIVSGAALWPDDAADFSSLTFRAGAVLTVSRGLTLSANVARGYRAPHITDLGTVGLTGSGFEVSPAAIAGLGGTVGSTADATAISLGLPADALDSEESLSYEGSVRFRRGGFDSGLAVFVNDIDGNLQKQALILPPGAVGTSLGDQVVDRQTAGGAVFVPLNATVPVLINANFDDARIWGVEHTLEVRFADGFRASTVFTYLHAEDDRTRLPPNIEGGTPAPDGWLKVRWEPAGGRFWVEPYVHAAAKQDRLSSLDLGDRRTGAGRSRNSIAAFFNNGARARGLVGTGPDGVSGNADDVFLQTGETLLEIQNRVLGTAASSSLVPEIPSYVTFNLRGGYRLALGHEIQVDLENINDENYRGISWGVDAPGRNFAIRYVGRF
jgi:hemoglobin/transferrin/lactoferrin receptor protein